MLLSPRGAAPNRLAPDDLPRLRRCASLALMTSSISDLVTWLADGDFHSGESLGEALGISRAAVWKRIQQARHHGYDIQAVVGRGYRLAAEVAPLPTAELLRAQFPSGLQSHVRLVKVCDVVDSTNERCQQWLTEGEGAVVCLARSQLAGRGRHGRNWLSPAGRNFYGSVGAHLPCGFAALEGLSLALGVCVLEALRAVGVKGLGLKWPNDLMTPAGEKVGGILIEVQGDPQGPCQVVMGLGLNVYLSAQERAHLDRPVAALTDLLPAGAVLTGLEGRLLAAMVGLVLEFPRHGFAPYRERWSEADIWSGAAVAVAQGKRVVAGTERGVDARGNLCLETGDGLQVFYGGEVSLRALS